ncbi:MAG: response regulator [Lachnospiraceae bacterium]|nr:response regulator [Lachnospiraceae bacterium]
MLISKIFKKYITNEELEVQHRLMNIVLMVGILVLPICVIFDMFVGLVFDTLIPLLLLLGIFILAFFIANVKNRANFAGIILTVTASDFLLPYLYFQGGGRNSSMPAWFILSSIFVWLLVRGWPCYVVFASNLAAYSLTFYFEYTHPEYVTALPDTESEYMDIAVGIALIIAMIGIIFKFQNRLYEKKRTQLEEKEAELRDTNVRLEHMSEAKSRFLASMSHEIRTPINAIIGMNEMILRESRDENITGYAESIEQASGTLLSLINDILDLSKIEEGLMEIIPEEYELFSILNDCETILRRRAMEKGLKMEIENDPKIPAVLYGDQIRIRQMLLNLMTNAIKYTEGGLVRVQAGFEEKGENGIILCLTVSDTGRGISKEGIAVLFESYSRLEERRNHRIEGTGLGLAITKQFVELMDGTIDVKSEPDKGSRFTIRIPQKVISGEPMGAYEEKRKHRLQKNERRGVSFRAPEARILLTDDVPMNLKVITSLLKDTQVRIDLAESGKECLRKYEAEHYDLIFLDHMMPEMDGIETLRHLKETERYRTEHTPVIALTANAILGADKTYLDTGFNDYLTKPARGGDLEEMILKYLDPELVIPAEKKTD